MSAFPSLPNPEALAFALWNLTREAPTVAVRFQRCEDALRNIVFADVTRASRARDSYRREALSQLHRLRDHAEQLKPEAAEGR